MLRKLRIAFVAEVGIFWIFQNKIYARKQSLASLQYIEGTKAASFFHQAEWDSVKKQIERDFPDFDTNLKYNDVPRGRIWQEQKDSLFVLISSKEIIACPELVDKILAKFNISKNANFTLQTDEIYNFFPTNHSSS